ncbi:RNA polymerase sigma factor SigI [bioreactor metagenome]|uniref:RNA polymerase sigma factor SigI n=1 Tax=bioreactor metagenome TaxID=1076179 RepID=A0A644ZAW3_9ZZZZ|nr:hypothetical protein [Christensenella sp.]
MALDESALALLAATDEAVREELIIRQEKNILRIASHAKHRFVTKSDDEWAIALCAFSRAIDTYRAERGAFAHYAEILIRRSLIDAHRAEAKRAQEISVSPELFEGESEEVAQNPVRSYLIGRSMHASDRTLRDEILAANEELGRFGFGFYDLTRCSPEQERTREACAHAADAILSSAENHDHLLRTMQLPVKRLVECGAVSKKILERYRKYIIAMVVIRAGDYPALQGYLHAGRGETT